MSMPETCRIGFLQYSCAARSFSSIYLYIRLYENLYSPQMVEMTNNKQ